MVDPRGPSVHATEVKGTSVRSPEVIVHQDKLKILCGDIGNAFIGACDHEQEDFHCFKFHFLSHKPLSDCQFAPSRMIFDVKNDLRRKGRLGVKG